MSEYPKVIERPYKVFYGFESRHDSDIKWSHDKSFRLESDAEAYAERIAEEYEFVKIEKKESE